MSRRGLAYLREELSDESRASKSDMCGRSERGRRAEADAVCRSAYDWKPTEG
ncbi:MAG: hypothetical protein HY711_02685 [Candidatus Melainabacteria bacterium]|nr:hypothetical protein [Candidatus Melainabacteria bacterium]